MVFPPKCKGFWEIVFLREVHAYFMHGIYFHACVKLKVKIELGIVANSSYRRITVIWDSNLS